MNPRRGLVEKELKADAKSVKPPPTKPVFGQDASSALMPKVTGNAAGSSVPAKAGAPKIASTSAATSANVLTGAQVAARLRVDEEIVREWLRRGFIRGTFQAVQLYELEKFKTSYPGEITRAQQAGPPEVAAPPVAPAKSGGKKEKTVRPKSAPEKDAPPEKTEKAKKSTPGLNPLMFLAVALAAVRDVFGGKGKKKKAVEEGAPKSGGGSGRLVSRGKLKGGKAPVEENGPAAVSEPEAPRATEPAHPAPAREEAPPARPPVMEPEAAPAPLPSAKTLQQGAPPPNPPPEWEEELPPLPPLPPPSTPRIGGSGSRRVPELTETPPAPLPPPPTTSEPSDWLTANDSIELDIDHTAFRNEPQALNPLREETTSPFASGKSLDIDAFMVFDDEPQPSAGADFSGLFDEAPSGEPGAAARANISGIALAGGSGQAPPPPHSARALEPPVLDPSPFGPPPLSSQIPAWDPFAESDPPSPEPAAAPALEPLPAMELPPAPPPAPPPPPPQPVIGSARIGARPMTKPTSLSEPPAPLREIAPVREIKDELEERLAALNRELEVERERSQELDRARISAEAERNTLRARVSELQVAQEDAVRSRDAMAEKLKRAEAQLVEAQAADGQVLSLQGELAAALRQGLAASQRFEQDKIAISERFEKQREQLERSLAEARSAADARKQSGDSLEQQRAVFEQQIQQLRQVQSQREQQFQTLRSQMLQAQEQRDAQILSLRAQLSKTQDTASSPAELSQARAQVSDLQARLQLAEQTMQNTQREHVAQSQRWAKELQTAGSWVGKLTEAVSTKDKRIAELETQMTRFTSARPTVSDSEAQAQLMAAKVEVASLKRSGEVAQLQMGKLEAQLQESRTQAMSLQKELMMARERLEKQMLEEKSPRDAGGPQLGKRLSLNRPSSESDKKRDDLG